MNKDRYPLRQVIIDDLIAHNKLVILLLILLIATCISTVWITNQTRSLITQKAQLFKENKYLDDQYLRLQLEENAKSYKEKVEEKAKKLGMQRMKKEQEVIIME